MLVSRACLQRGQGLCHWRGWAARSRVLARLLVGLLAVGIGYHAQAFDTTDAGSSRTSAQVLSIVSGAAQTPLSDTSFQRLGCVLEQLQEPFEVSQIYWRRAHQELHQGRFDGLFPVTPAAAAHLGQVSAPLYVEQWYFYWVPAAGFTPRFAANEPIGVIAGSLQEAWLRSRGHQAFMFANSAAQLAKLVYSQRVRAVLANADVMDNAPADMPLQRRLYRYAPVSVAFSRDLSVRRSEFIEAFNGKISACYQTRFALPAAQEHTLVERLSVHFDRWKQVPELADQLLARTQAYAKQSPEQVAAIDQAWHQAFLAGRYDQQQQHLDASLSQRLLRARINAGGVLNAVWVLDGTGRLYASSDYFPHVDYQSSPLFSAAKVLRDGEHYIGQVMYSETFRRAQVLVGIALRHPKSDALVGVMAFAFDLEVGVNSLLEPVELGESP